MARGGSSIGSWAAILVVGAAVLWLLPSPGDEPAEPDDPAAPLPSGLALVPGVADPSPQRVEISGIETLIWDGDPLDFGLPGRISARSMELAQEYLESKKQQQLGLELMTFASFVGGMSDGGYGAADLATIRREWLRVRAGFAPATWMRDADAPVREPATPTQPSGVDLDALTAYADGLEALAGRAATETAAFGDWHDHPERSRERGKLVDRYNDWVRGWDAELRKVQPPARPSFDAATELQMVWQELEQAHTGLRTMTVAPGSWPMPDQSSFERDLGLVEMQLVGARAKLQKLR